MGLLVSCQSQDFLMAIKPLYEELEKGLMNWKEKW